MLTNPTVTMVIEEEINPTVTLFVKDDGSNDEEEESDDHTERSSNKEHMYTLLTGSQNTGDDFEFEYMNPYNIVNEINLMCATISMVMMDYEENIGALIDNIQQVELGLSHVTINTDNVLLSNSYKNTIVPYREQTQ